MITILGASVTDAIIKFFQNLLKSINIDTVFWVFVALMLASILAGILRIIWCYEGVAMRQMRRINKYLKENPNVNDENLVEFHNRMKKLPRRIRDRWQLFMLERAGSPSRYLSVEYCIKRPLYNSAILTVKKLMLYATFIVSLLSIVVGLCYFAIDGASEPISLAVIIQTLVTPLVCILIGCAFNVFLQLRYTSINHSLYDTFTVFVRNIDKATNQMPDYVDYELLFTKKEIEQGIPVLREYLEKKALEEQRLLEKAKQEEANISPYDFASLGINGEQLMDRAVTESEKFFMKKADIQQQITSLEKQLQKTEQQMEDIERDGNKKLQAIKENLERLDKAMAETTNNVEVNYNRRLVSQEISKKEAIEKDMANMIAKEKVAADALRVEIQKRKEEIDSGKKIIEDALKSEYDTFATKVYQELNERITRDNSEQMHEMEMIIAKLKAKIKEINRDLISKDNILEERNLELDNLYQQVDGKGRKKNKKDNKSESRRQEQVQEVVQDVPAPVEEIQYAEPEQVDQQQAEYTQDQYIQEQPYMDQSTYLEQAPTFVYQDNIAEQPYDAPYEQPVEEVQQDYQYEQQPVQENIEPVDAMYQEPVYEQNYEQNNMQPEFVVPNFDVPLDAPVEQYNESQPQEQEPQVVEEQSQEQPVEEEKKEDTEKKTKKSNKKSKSTTDEAEKEVTESSEKKDEKSFAEIKEELKEEIKKEVQASQKEEANKKEKDNEDLVALQKQISQENERLKKQQEELRLQIDETLKTMEKASKASKAERTANIKKIKLLIADLKNEAKEAKARGASKNEINKINKSVAELLKVIADYQATSGSSTATNSKK